MMGVPAEKPSRSIAVVVVHGVADQQPHESARAIAAMLSSRNDGQHRYATFTEQDIRIDVEAPVHAQPKPKKFGVAAKPPALESIGGARREPQPAARTEERRRGKGAMHTGAAANASDQLA